MSQTAALRRPRPLVLADLIPGAVVRDVLLVVGAAAPFIAGDVIKAAIAAGLLPVAWRLAGHRAGGRGAEPQE
jgi:hypothetical protein